MYAHETQNAKYLTVSSSVAFSNFPSSKCTLTKIPCPKKCLRRS